MEKIRYRNYRIRHRIIFFFRNIDVPGFRWMSLFLPKVLLPKKETVVAHFNKSAEDLWVWIDPANDFGVEQSLYELGTYESGTLQFMKKFLGTGDTFIDVGSNIGWHAMCASKYVGSDGVVWSFEPSPKLFQILEKNLAENKISNLVPFQCGLGEKKSELKFFLNDSINKGASSAVVKAKDAKEITIKVLTLDEIVAQQNRDIRMMKFDIEGMEMMALKGAKAIIDLKKPFLIVECSAERAEQPNARKELIDYLKTLKEYSWFKSSNGKERANGIVPISFDSDWPVDDNVYGIPKK